MENSPNTKYIVEDHTLLFSNSLLQLCLDIQTYIQQGWEIDVDNYSIQMGYGYEKGFVKYKQIEEDKLDISDSPTTKLKYKKK
jgi:hypothetical protein